MIIIGSLLDGRKHARSSGNSDFKCYRQILIYDVEDSSVCCWGDHDEASHEKYQFYQNNGKNPIVCDIAYDKMTKFLCGYWGYVIPLIPLALNTFFDLVFTHIDSDTSVSINAKNKIETCVTDPRVKAAWTAHFLRLLVYICIFVFRTVVLYMLADFIQHEVQPTPDEDCWYYKYVSSHSCINEVYDFSDHIVFFVANYLIPVATELAFVGAKIYTSKLSVILNLLRFSLPISSCIILATLSYRIIFNTSAYFHTLSECLFGYILVVVTIGWPMLMLSNLGYWGASVFGSRPR